MDKNGCVNKNFVGVGMVYQFCKALEAGENPTLETDNLLDLVAMGQIGDASDVADYEIRNKFSETRIGKHHVTIIEKKYSKKKIANGETISAKSLSFSIIPMANAVSRIGDEKDKANLVTALAGVYDENDCVEVERKRKSKVTGKMEKVTLVWSHYTLILDELTKIKSKQDRTITKGWLKKLDGNIFQKQCNHCRSRRS